MQSAETPVQIIRDSISLFELTWFVGAAVQEGRITPAPFREQLWLNEGGWSFKFNMTHTAEELAAEALKLIVTTLGITAMSTNKALEVVYGKKFDPADTSAEGSARVLIYQIRCAFAHDPLNPVWWTPKPQTYNHQYRVTVQVNRQNDEPVIRKIEFNPPSLKDQPLSPDHIGGLGGYLGLLYYYLAKIEAHPKGNHPYSPSVEKS
jgi:hypothetical protein